MNITTQAFIDSLPELPTDFEIQLGDIVGMVKVAQAAAAEFLNRVEAERDPNLPTQPKMRWVGTQLVRPAREALWAEVIRPSYALAKKKGYRNTYADWEYICLEYVAAHLKSKKIP